MEEKRPLALYVHIPFCVRKCNYCDFLSGPANEESKKSYVEALVNEIRSYRELANRYEVKTIFIGGGTPSSIHEDLMVEVMDALRDVFRFADEMEITIEINPGTVTREKLVAYKKAGINRISFGLQSANDQELKLLGRIHSYEEFVQNYELAREVGFENINIDLMSALPGQTITSYQNTLDRIIDLKPEHISSYSLIIEEGTPFYKIYGEDASEKPRAMLPSEDDERKMYDMTREIMHQHGYERYEISNYAKAGYECKHNCVYWRRGDYLGLGSGSASLIEESRYSNVRDLKEYIRLASLKYDVVGDDYLGELKSWGLGIEEFQRRLHEDFEELSEASEMEEFMFLGLRMMDGVSITEFKNKFNKSIYEVYGSVIDKFVQENLLSVSNDRIALTLHGIDISNYVMSEFMFDEE